MTITEGIIIAVLGLIGTLVGSYLSNRKSAAVMEYRLEQLERKVQVHNNLIDRMYRVEEQTALQDSELKRHNERLKALEHN